MENSNENTEQMLSNMSVKELKALLSSRNVDHHAVEKSDLIELAKKSLSESRGNELWKEKSPYLLQHKGNPVHWMAYGPRAFEIAKKEDKPILISIGYATCHWCHVMEHESFEDQIVANALNKDFISVKVDREEHPDVDALYMRAAQAIGGGGGWPLNLFVSPDLTPFFAGTYFPKHQFMNILRQISMRWKSGREELLHVGEQVQNMLNEYDSFFGKLENELGVSLFNTAFKNMYKRFDNEYGGFGKAPKFPPSMQLKAFLRVYRRSGDPKALEMVEKTLEGMARGGMYDHLGGGFARYSTDNTWLVPHFEKMLYDNALLVQTYLEAYQITGKQLYRSVAEETLHYILTVMQHSEGGYFSAEDADSEGVEGKFYVWKLPEIESLLPKETVDHFCKVYGVSEKGNFEHSNILNLQKGFDWSEKQNPMIKEAHRILFETREKRIHPLKDDKVLTGWNGLMIHSMALAARILGEKKYLESAQKAAKFLYTTMWKDGKLLRRWREGEGKYQGTLDDYAYMIQGLLELFQTDFDETWLNWATELQNLQDKLFWDDKDGGYFFTPSESDVNLLIRIKEFIDDARPNSNAVSALNLLQLYHITYKTEYSERAAKLLKSVGQLIEKSPEAYAQTLIAVDYKTDKPKQVAAISNNKEAGISVVRELQKVFSPNAVIVMGPEGSKIPILEAKTETKGKPTFYLCEGTVCKAPTTELDKLKAELLTFSAYKLE